MLLEEKKAIDELIMLKHFLETEERYEGQEREVNAIKTVLNLITKLQKENEEKDKQIDLMAEYIYGDDTSLSNYLCRENGKCDKVMIKQYFEQLAKEKE